MKTMTKSPITLKTIFMISNKKIIKLIRDVPLFLNTEKLSWKGNFYMCLKRFSNNLIPYKRGKHPHFL